MPFVKRDANNKITDTYSWSRGDAQEELTDEQYAAEMKPTTEDIKKELQNIITEKKKSVAYNGYPFKKEDKVYIASTKENDIGKTAARAGKVQRKNLESTNWTCYSVSENKLVDLTFLAQDFLDLADEADDFINAQFVKQNLFMSELAGKNDSDLTPAWIDDFKSRIDSWE